MRQIVLDTETTGLSASLGHRLIEVGCLELVNRQLTGQQFHAYLNPQREVDAGAFNVHGISNEFLQDKPLFADVAPQLLTFLGDAELIIHNAPFDLSFLNMELQRIGHTRSIEQQCPVLDTLVFAKQKHPGQKNNLDALCKRYGVNNTNRTLHGALLDAELLAFVYLAMTGGQINLFAQDKIEQASTPLTAPTLQSNSPVYMASVEEQAAHEAFMAELV
jgi:DNA polymerase-3 subunit epsilon